jgi:hypothetical protein
VAPGLQFGTICHHRWQHVRKNIKLNEQKTGIFSLVDFSAPLTYILALPICVIAIHWILVGILALRDGLIKNTKHINLVEWMSLAKVVSINQLVALPSSMIATHYFLRASNDLEAFDLAFVPHFSQMLYKFVLCMIVYEISFFYIHFMVHHPLVNNTPQSQKHTLDPIEYILLNVIPLSLAIFITHSDLVTSAVFMTAVVIAPIFEQSHGVKERNGIVDHIQGTCKNFLQSENDRKILLSMVKPLK